VIPRAPPPLPRGGGAVMASRTEALDSLDFFPTPPWATRALCELVLPAYGHSLAGARVWEPACGEGHMAEALREYAAEVIASDVHDYGVGANVGSFVGEGGDVMMSYGCGFDWIITNPPFNLAEDFFARAIIEARGLALLVRTTWLESKARYARIFAPTPPSVVAIFSERVPMVKGRWDPNASTATSYAWVAWLPDPRPLRTSLFWIPPGQRRNLTLAADYQRWR
jgi:hypothetical protein